MEVNIPSYGLLAQDGNINTYPFNSSGMYFDVWSMTAIPIP